jgi:hypothetical protein
MPLTTMVEQLADRSASVSRFGELVQGELSTSARVSIINLEHMMPCTQRLLPDKIEVKLRNHLFFSPAAFKQTTCSTPLHHSKRLYSSGTRVHARGTVRPARLKSCQLGGRRARRARRRRSARRSGSWRGAARGCCRCGRPCAAIKMVGGVEVARNDAVRVRKEREVERNYRRAGGQRPAARRRRRAGRARWVRRGKSASHFHVPATSKIVSGDAKCFVRSLAVALRPASSSTATRQTPLSKY